MTFLVILAVIALLAVAILGPTVAKRRTLKTEAAHLQGVAHQFGWSYHPSDNRWVNVLSGSPPAAPVKYPRRGSVLNVMDANMDGTPVTFFHLLAANAVSGRGAVGIAWEKASVNKTEHTFCALRLPGPVPPMTVCPPADWAARRVDVGRLANRYLTGDPAFDQQFVLSTPRPAEAVAALTPQLRQVVAGTWTPFTVSESGHLLTWRPGRITDGHQLVAQGRALAQVAACLAHR